MFKKYFYSFLAIFGLATSCSIYFLLIHYLDYLINILQFDFVNEKSILCFCLILSIILLSVCGILQHKADLKLLESKNEAKE